MMGRALAYLGLAVVVVAGLAHLPGVSAALQKWGHLFLGPVIIVVAMLLLELIELPLPAVSHAAVSRWANHAGLVGAFVLGVLFALAFCPVSAAYFSMVITLLAPQPIGAVMLVLVYGVGTALPVVGLAALIGLGVQWASQAFRLLATAEKILRTVTGLILLLIGLYFVARFNFDLPIGIGF
jgi:cytochrome c biogenesis protein CcdA